ncbi:MAG: 1-acyl-sn-glycerol-3-phosphate acyltransferase [Bacteroidetes Order II. Incertae sedis bacterium]|nr:1-acyl-sn-glycerol-3-phosphate acyltransferase [Bacteroidetes Order II. bacterium]MBT5250386.1 1-acyl-sn-glycerol-3-phosphate acyltransferase [Bacteroidetes Order II. bacterium]MBT6201163.1 1-acyl-sn-glycerol-3-phosphate acyltransferase [Bacteroidetes Order II. bacterium]MBT6424705.1 1-acyl-sn-glycerol-3-phosphate acyltransferase [Bacteroidetes Order II. bacterium]MBT7401110.1 1-acyl-sn-glycerol-3-phosphate acyltransferase [Bacteroidetes Order II. bacterium]
MKSTPSSPHPPFGRVASELAFRSSVIAFSKRCWHLELIGDQYLPPGPCFIYGNHSNNYDPFIYNAFTELGQSTAGVMTMEYLRSGVLSRLFTAAGIVGTEKRVPEPHLIRKIWKMIEQKRRIVIFPEGGRRWHGRPDPWIESTAKVFMRLGVPVYPVVINGSYVGWPRWATYPRPAHIKVEVHPAIDFSDNPTLESSLDRLKKPISKDENVVSEAVKPKRAFRPISGVTKLLYRDPYTGHFGGLIEQGANRLVQRHGDQSWTMNPDSSLIHDQTGKRVLTADMYESIRTLPFTAANQEALLSNVADVQIIENDQIVRAYRRERISIFKDHLAMAQGFRIPLDEVQYTGLERNNKIWILTPSKRVIATFKYEGSVRAWQDILNRIIPELNC